MDTDKTTKYDRKKTTTKSHMLILMRNRFYYSLYRHATLIFIVSVLTFLTSATFLYLLSKKPVDPQYIVVHEDGKLMTLTPINECKSVEEMQKFLIRGVNKIYKYSYVNYSDEIMSGSYYFTGDGWGGFLDQLSKSNTLAAVKDNQWIVSVEITGTPQVLKQYDDGEKCVTEMKVPLNVLFIGKSGQSLTGDLFATVVRQSVINNPEGLGIQSITMIQRKL